MRMSIAVICLSVSCACAQETLVRLNGAGTGRTFEGIGALSAGASSRLLIDYPEPQRTQILDYLFKPNYGASLQHLKVEIGGDTNSTDGSEPSHMHTRSDLNFHRGYEWWLMKEAKKRNPNIILDTLPWGAPGWIGDGKYYSQDMADYIVKFIQGAKKVHGLDIDFTGIWNEKMYDAAWIKLLRKTLDAAGLKTKIIAADLYENQWKIIDEMKADPELDAAIYAVGAHYPRVKGKVITPKSAIDSGRRLWSSEDQPALGENPMVGSRDWVPGGKALAQLYNTNYIDGRMVKTEIWSPITSYYDNLAAPNSGLMYANTPWSGYYNVQSTIWVTAHTTQFVQPGWQYIDDACGYLPGKGTYVTLKSPSSGAYSVVVETIDATEPQNLNFRIEGGLSTGIVHVWRSNGTSMFEKQADVTPRDGLFSITLDSGAIYTLSTTTGQGKGTATPPLDKPFPMPYAENFDKVPEGGIPKYLAEQNGAFEVTGCAVRKGHCLRQVVNHRPISWGIDPDPFTYLGSAEWADYEVGADVLLEEDGQAAVLGRIDSADYFKEGKARWPSGYIFSVRHNGEWELNSAKYKAPTVKLGSGAIAFGLKTWHRLALRFHGAEIEALVDGKTVTKVSDTTHARGMAGFGTGWNLAQFDNFAVRHAVPARRPVK